MAFPSDIYRVIGFSLYLVLVLPVAVWGDLRLKRWYNKRYGAAETPARNYVFEALSISLVIVLGIAAGVIALLTSLPYQFIFVGLLAGIGIMVLMERRLFGGWRPYSVAVGLVFAVFTLIMWTLQPPLTNAVNGWLYLAMASAMIIGGFLEHRLIVNTLGNDHEKGSDVVEPV